MNFDMKIKDISLVSTLLSGARLVVTQAREYHTQAVLDNQAKGRLLWRFKNLREAEVIVASLDLLWHKNFYASRAHSIDKKDPVSVAELGVDKAKVARARARRDEALKQLEVAEREWLDA
jgi:hypothetical protein